MIFHNTKLINLWETAVSPFLFVLLVVVFLAERCRQPLATLRERLHLSARGYSFIALRFLICNATRVFWLEYGIFFAFLAYICPHCFCC